MAETPKQIADACHKALGAVRALAYCRRRAAERGRLWRLYARAGGIIIAEERAKQAREAA